MPRYVSSSAPPGVALTVFVRAGLLAAGAASTLLPALSFSSVRASSGAKPEANPAATGSPFVAKWNALGPGCPGIDAGGDGPRPDTPFLHRTPTKEEPRTHVFRFTLAKQRVTSPRPTGEETRQLAFGAECSIRMVLEPPGGTRIVGAMARSTYRITKAQGPEAWVLSDLQLGNRTVAKRRVDFPSDLALSGRIEELALVPGRTPEESMPETRCGQSKILGLDTIFAVKRKTTRDAVGISLGGGSVIEIVVDLAPC